MGEIESFQDIEAWQKARILTKSIYEVTKNGAFAEDHGLKNQIRRASVSIMSNIAEGYERGGNKEFKQFLAQAKGSTGEVESQLFVARDIGYINDKKFNELIELTNDTANLIGAFMNYLKNSSRKGQKYD